MNEQSDKWDNQWKQLLTHCHGEVQANEGFKSNLLDELKRKVADSRTNAATDEPETAVLSEEEDRNWSRLLTNAYVPCAPRHHFKEMLLCEMKTRQAEAQQPETSKEEQEVETMLSAYEPVVPRKEFQTRLLTNLKERQRATVHIRKTSRRRTIFMSAMSSMAAAAAVIFVVWVMPTSNTSRPVASPAPIQVAQAAAPEIRNNDFGRENILASATSLPETLGIPASAGLALASLGSYRVKDAFNGSSLPSTLRGIGMEINQGDGWQLLDETNNVAVHPGILLRPRESTEVAGLGFGDGSTVTMRPDTIIETTDRGLAVRRGVMTVNVPANSDSKFYMHFDERDLAIEPGTMLAVTVPSPEDYAEGGAPAPEVKVLDGGMAVAKGKGGNGILLANRAYRLDRYVTPDLPSRPLCFAECENLEKALFERPEAPAVQQERPMQLFVASEQPSTPTSANNQFSAVGFARKGSKWLANNYEGQATIKIGYLSDEYFALANARRDLAATLSLGSEVVFDGGDGNFYEIYR